MKKFRLSKIVGIVLVFCTATAITASAQTLTTLYRFCPQTCPDGAQPYAGLVQATDGNFYGTTRLAGTPSYGPGTVFKITSSGMLTTLHNFSYFDDGGNPEAVLVLATDGNFYGTTSRGGAEGAGAVFKVTSEGTLTSLYSFCVRAGCADGSQPVAGLAQGSDGNFYGTTWIGGAPGPGTVFKITPSGAFTTLYSFCSQPNCADGEYVYGGLVRANDGSFYGTTALGGAYGEGTVFKITSSGTLTTLHSFCAGGFFCADGADPQAALIQATDGNFYGTTQQGGGTFSLGTVFKITPSGTLTTLHSFCPAGPPCTDGYNPVNGLVQATDGNFYGMTGHSGDRDPGTIFQITPDGRFVTLYTFHGPDGAGRGSTLVQATDGNFYGTTMGGGIYDQGTVFRLSLPVLVPTTTALVTDPNPSNLGQLVTITATVGPPGPPIPTGTVSFTSNGTAIPGCTAVLLASDRTAVCTTSTLAVGTDAIVATYSGDTNYSGSSGSLSQLVNPLPSPLQFVAVTPCRLIDTRLTGGPIQGGTSRDFPIPQEGGCNIPTTAAAYSLNVSVVPQGSLGYLTIWPTGEGRPVVATLNSIDGRIKADAAIVLAGTNGAVSVYVTQTANVILDINGYFAAASGSTLAFYPLTPCRVADTRRTDFPPGLGSPFLTGLHERDFPILNATTCNIPSSAAAYSLNFSVVPHGALGYMTVWPTGQSRPLVSTLNDIPGTIIANAAIVPAGTTGQISVYPSNDTDLIIDINGYFAAPGPGGLSLYAVAPCRVIDTRQLGPPFSGTLTPPVDVLHSFCGPPATAQAYVFNATVVPQGVLGYLTLWPDGQPRPGVSTLNALDGSITNNMAIVPSTNGKVDAYASGITQLILDISSYFAP
jgi:uncharacterized repeat protein (TIGR03803 family)